MQTPTDVVGDTTSPTTGEHERRNDVVLVSAHGGSGASSVAQLLDVPELSVGEQLRDPGRLVVVTARTTAVGFDRLLTTVARLPAATGVVVVASQDAPLREPAGVRARAKSLQRGDRDVALVVLPYQPAWRHSPAHLCRPSKTYLRQLAKVAAVIHRYERNSA